MSLSSKPTAVLTGEALVADLQALLELQLDRPIAMDDSTRIVEDLGLDSVDAVIFLGAVEEKFGIDLPLANFDHVQTIGELRVHLDAALAKAA